MVNNLLNSDNLFVFSETVCYILSNRIAIKSMLERITSKVDE